MFVFTHQSKSFIFIWNDRKHTNFILFCSLDGFLISLFPLSIMSLWSISSTVSTKLKEWRSEKVSLMMMVMMMRMMMVMIYDDDGDLRWWCWWWGRWWSHSSRAALGCGGSEDSLRGCATAADAVMSTWTRTSGWIFETKNESMWGGQQMRHLRFLILQLKHIDRRWQLGCRIT